MRFPRPSSTQHQHTRLRRAVIGTLALLLAAAAVLWSPLGAPGSASPSERGWTWPVDGAHRVTAPFRAPAHRFGPGHRGMDVAAASGTAVRSPADGVVAFRGTVVDRPLVTIEVAGGYVITLEPVASDLSPGHLVRAGDAVGAVAIGGHATAGTMHVGVRLGGEYVNPRPLFGDVPRAVLYPCCEGIPD